MKSKEELNFKKEQIIKYMGNKQNILFHVVKVIMNIHPENKYFLDLMAGTNSVAYAIKTLTGKNIKIITNDVQYYSYIISEALIKNNNISAIGESEAKKDLFDNYIKNLNQLNKEYTDSFIIKNQYRTRKRNRNIISQIRNKTPYCLFTFYYAQVFFSIKQCKEIDSLRFAIEKVKNKLKRSFYLSCLLHAVSYGSYSFGHFAQPRRISDEYKKITERSILNLFYKKLKAMHIRSNDNDNMIYNMNYIKLLDSKSFIKLAKGIGTIYLDPPYSGAHYSRFYHLLETLVKYDYPENEYKGLYRHDRFQSDFCRKSTVKNAFRRVIEFAYKNKSNLVISYSNSGLLNKKQIKDLCREFYKKDNVWHEKDIHHKHSTQGNRTVNGVMEQLVVCKY